jgi:hypothetical protein
LAPVADRGGASVVSSLFAAGTLIVLLVSSVPAAVHAQEVPERRPTPTLFGAPNPRGETEGGLSMTGSLFGSYDDNILLGGQGSDTRAPTFLPRTQLRGASTGYDTTLFFRLPSQQPTFRASVASAGRYFPEFREYVAGRQMAQAAVSAGASPWRDTNLRLTGSGRYSMNAPPFATAASLSDSDIDVPSGEDSVRLRRTNDVRGQVTLDREWRSRKSLGMVAGIHSAQIDGGDRHEIYELGGRLGVGLARYGTFRAGYTWQDVDRGATRYVVHHLNIGGDYGRPLSASRRAFIKFSGGSAAIETSNRLRMNAIGDVDFWYEFKQSWVGAVRYHRGVTFIDEIADPLLSDGGGVELTGLFSRRLEFNTSATFAQGVVGLRSGNSYQMYGARSQLRYALTRVLALYGEYLLFHYEFPNTVSLAGRLPPAFNRQAVRVGVTVATHLIDMGPRR